MATEEDHSYVSDLHRYAFDLAFDLAQAIAAYELHASTLRGDRWQKISGRGLNRPAGAISGLLRSNTILAIGRLWDKDPRSHSVDGLLDRLQSPVVERMYGPTSEGKTFSREALARLKERARLMRENPQFVSVVHVRNKHVAHHDVFDPTKPVDPDFRPMKLDDELEVINLTAPILVEAAATFGCILLPLVDLRRMWGGEAAKFWDSLAGPSRRPAI